MRSRWNRMSRMQPGGRATWEFRLPAGAGRARWQRLELSLYHDPGFSARLQVFDWAQRHWVPVAGFKARDTAPPQQRLFPEETPEPAPGSSLEHSITLPSPERFVNPVTDALLVQIENSGDFEGGVDLGVRGDGQARY